MPPSAASPGRASPSASRSTVVTTRADGHHAQEPRAFQEGEVGVVEVDAEVVGGQRADEQRREEGAHAGGGGHPHPLQDVEEELHGPIA